MENDNNNALGDLLNNSTVIEHINSSNKATILNITSVAEDFETQDLDYPSFDEETNYDRPIPLTVENFTLLPGEIVLMNTKNVVNLSLTTTVHRIGTLYQTNYQMFFIDDSTRQMVTTIPNGQVMEIKKLKGHVTVKYHDGSNTPSTSNVNNNNNNSNLIKSSSIEPLNLEKQPSQNEHLTINNNANNNNEQSSSTSSNTLATSTTTNISNSNYQQQQLLSPPPQQPQSNSRKDKLSKSVSTPIGLNNHSNPSPLLTSTTTTTTTTTTNNNNNNNVNSQTTWYSNGVSEKALILEIRCKDFMITRFCLPFNERGNEAYELMNKLTMVDNNLQLLFSYKFSPFKGVVQPFDGWLFYDPVEEYTRQGLIGTGSQWRLSKINSKFEICSTYPQLLMIPFSISDYLLNKSASYRNKNRFPVCTWRHKTTFATLSRSSTPLNGLSKNRCEEDELLIQAIRKCTPNNNNVSSSNNNSSLYIYDIKSKSSASGALSLTSSSSTEDISHYLNCNLESVSLSNIHELRESQLKLFKTIRNWNEKKGWTEIQNTGWLQNTSKLLSCTKRILQHIHIEGMSVLIHCIDGTDRTSQVSSLVQLCADPYYRTIKGFIVLVCKEWISFGHKFMTRNGIGSMNSNGGTSPSNTKQSSPIFLQFIDAVWQLTKQFPTSFEFSDKFLSVILYHLNSNLFGTFLYDCEKDRQSNKLSTETESLWTLLLGASKNSSLLNQLYNCNNKDVVNTNVDGASTTTTTSTTSTTNTTTSQIKMDESIIDGVLFPNSQGVQLWSDYYLKWKTPNKASRKSNTLITQSLGISYVNGDLIVVQKKRRSKRSSTNGGNSSSKHHRKSISGGGGKSSDDLTKSSSKVKTRSSKRKSTIPNNATSPIVETPSIEVDTTTVDEPNTINDKIISTPVIIVQEQDSNETNKQIPNNQMDSSIEFCKKEDRTYSMESEHQSSAISPPLKQQTLEPILEGDSTATTVNTTTTSASTSSSNKMDKEIRKQEKEKRKQEKEKKAKDRLERKEKKREAKEKEQREKEQLEQKPKADITVVLQSPSKSSKAMGALTMPVRGSGNKSRISIFSSPLTTPNNSNSPTLIPNLNNVENTSVSNSGNASGDNSPNLTSSNYQQQQQSNINNTDQQQTNNTSFSKRIFKTLRGTKSLSQPIPQQQA